MSLEWICEVCKAKRGQKCHNTISRDRDTPLPGRDEHIARKLPPNPKETK